MKSKIHDYQSKNLMMSKILFTLLVIFFISISSFAQQGINYKAILKETNGNVLSDTEMVVQFTIHESTGTGPVVYQEEHLYTTDNNGLVILNIGSDPTPVFGTIEGIDWSVNQHFLRVSIGYSGGTIFFDPTEFMAVPYALSSKDNLWQRNGENAIAITEKVGIGISEPESMLHIEILDDTDGITIQSDNGDNSILLANFYSGTGNQSSNNRISSNGGNLTISRYLGGGEENPNLDVLELRNTGEVIAPNVGSYPSNSQSLMTKAASDIRYLSRGGNSDIVNIGIGNLQPESLFEVAHRNGAPTSIDLTNAFGIRNLVDTNDANDDESWQFYVTATGSLQLFRKGAYRGYFHHTSGAFVQTSDRRVKKDIISLENGTLNKVMQLNPVSYLMKDQTDTKRNLGLISQEVQELFPSITHYVEESDLLTLSYSELIPILIKALQEQQTIIEAQDAKDVIQDKSIEALVARLNLIEAKSSH